MKTVQSRPSYLREGSLVIWGARNLLLLAAFLLALFPSVIKMYETSHWYREGDPSIYDDAKDWFDLKDLPFKKSFDNPKVLMRVYFFIIPYILSALLIAIARVIPAAPLPASLHHGQQSRRTLGSVLRRTFAFPSFLVQLGSPFRISAGELIGVVVFLVLNIGTMCVRVRRSLPRGSKKIHFLVDLDESVLKDPIDPISWQACEVWAKTLGVISILNLGWYLLMPVGRKSVLLEALGMSWERAVKYHRWVGLYSVAIMFIHSVMYVAIWMHGDGHPLYDPDGEMFQRNMVPWYCSKNECDEDQERTLRVNIYGFVTMLLILVMTGFALPWVRRHRFEWFYYAHHLFVLVLVFVCLHYKGAIIYLIPGIAIYGVDKLVALMSYKKTAPVETRLVSSDVLEISFETGPGTEYKAGDYVFLNVPGVSFLEWHPFSLTSAPNANGKKVFFHLKEAGSWTKKVIDAAKERDDGVLPVRIDGFYGHSGACEDLKKKDGVVLVGGGIGVTPMISLAMELCETNTSPVALFWIVRTIDEFSIFSTELIEAQRRYKHLIVKVWITLSRPEPGNKDEGLVKSKLLEISESEQVERVLKSLNQNESTQSIQNTVPSVRIFQMSAPGMSGAFNAIAMALSIFLALVAFAYTAEMSREEKFAEVVVDKMSMIELGMVSFFVVVWIAVIVLIAHPLVRYMLQKYKPVSIKKPSAKNTKDIIDEDMTETERLDMSMSGTNTERDEEDMIYKTKCERENDIEGTQSDNEMLQSLVGGNIGCRPNLSYEFASFAREMASIAGGMVDIGVLACGPVQMVESINSICNVTSGGCSSGLENEHACFSFTEEDWEW